MAEKPQSAPQSNPSTVAPAAKRGSFRGDGKDPMIELTERAKIISQEAGTKVSSAMRDMISAAAGIAGFAVESARDLVQYMVRRGQMTQDEADKLIREAEASHMKRPAAERAQLTASKIAAEKAALAKKAALAAANSTAPLHHRPLVPGRMIAPVTPKAEKSAAKAETKKTAPVEAKKSPVAKADIKKAAPVEVKKPAKDAAKKPEAKATPVKNAASKPAAKAVKKRR